MSFSHMRTSLRAYPPEALSFDESSALAEAALSDPSAEATAEAAPAPERLPAELLRVFTVEITRKMKFQYGFYRGHVLQDGEGWITCPCKKRLNRKLSKDEEDDDKADEDNANSDAEDDKDSDDEKHAIRRANDALLSSWLYGESWKSAVW
ncbi:uncharacterized protein LOC133916439 [Phragmites australis]|uniref:uncharacterized protein LOC133916439 n=1 Tax=Phragmites australis TaxID=29695 RepID=UPI002D77628E|nr:uncharacterized protein LOC133916439 [Phragmites australis]